MINSPILDDAFASLIDLLPHSSLNTSNTVLTVDLSGRDIISIAEGGLDCFFTPGSFTERPWWGWWGSQFTNSDDDAFDTDGMNDFIL